MPPVLELKNLRKQYDAFTLDHVHMSLEEGFIMGLVGPNGAGKTTIIKLILGLLKRDDGAINIFGKDIDEHADDIKQQIGFVLDESDWYDSFTIKEMVKVISPFYHQWDQRLFKDYLSRFEIHENQRIEMLSKGMRMKFSLAIALSHHAKLIIMDEPTSGLDPIIRDELLEILQKLIAEGGKSILFSSHISSDVDKIADFITFIHGGRIIFSQSREEIADTYRLITGPLEYLDPDIVNSFDAIRRKKRNFTAITTNHQRIEKEFASYFRDGSMVMEQVGIDDIMLHLVKGGMIKSNHKL
jgi:ABC-2 type transport system ATP-binding protein